MSKGPNALLLVCSLLSFSCSSDSSEGSYTPILTAHKKVQDDFLDAAKSEGDERLIKTAKLEAWLLDNGYFIPLYRTEKPFVTRFYSMNYAANYVDYEHECDLSDAVAVTKPIKATDYESIRLARPKDRETVKKMLTDRGYVLKDELILPCSNAPHGYFQRGLFARVCQGEPEYDIAESCVFNKEASAFDITLKDIVLPEEEGRPEKKAVAQDFVDSYNDSPYSRLAKEGKAIDGVYRAEAVDEKTIRYFVKYKSPTFFEFFNSDCNYFVSPGKIHFSHYVSTIDPDNPSIASYTSTDPDVMPSIEYIDKSGVESFASGELDYCYGSSNLDGWEDYVIRSRYAEPVVRFLTNGHGDSHSSAALNNKNFRLFVLSLLKQKRVMRGEAINPTPSRDFGKRFLYGGGFAALENDAEIDGKVFPAGTEYNRLLEACLKEDPFSADAPKRYFEAAKQELGSEFFKQKVRLPISGRESTQDEMAYFKMLDEALSEFSQYVGIERKSYQHPWSDVPRNINCERVEMAFCPHDDPLWQLNDFLGDSSPLATF